MYSRSLIIVCVCSLFLCGQLFAQLDGGGTRLKSNKLPKALKFSPEATMVDFRFQIRPVIQYSKGVRVRGGFPEFYYITHGRMNGFKLNPERLTQGYYTGPTPMTFYRKDGVDEFGKPKFVKACSVEVVPGWTNVIILLRTNPSGTNSSAVAVESSLSKLPKGKLCIVNYTPAKMLFQFGENGEVHPVEPYKNVIVSLSKLPENNYIKVRAGLYVKNDLYPAYDTTWVLEKTYRGTRRCW